MSEVDYEFTASQNKIFEGLVHNMKRAAIVVAIASLILLAYHVIGHFGITLGAASSEAIYWIDLTVWMLISVIGIAVAFVLVRATRAFSAVIHTDGDDVKHLIAGLSGLTRVLAMIFWAGSLVSLMLAVSLVLLLLSPQ